MGLAEALSASRQRWSPVRFVRKVGAAIGPEDADQNLGHYPAAARAELLTATAARGLRQEVEPQRRLARPAGGSQTEWIVAERGLAHRCRHGLARGQAIRVAAREVAAGERVVGAELDLAGDRRRKLDQRAREATVDQLCPLRGPRPFDIEEPA